MTILNVWVEHDRALVGVDSHAADPFNPADFLEVRKIYHAERFHAVFAVRGLMGLFTVGAMHIANFPESDFDALNAAMPRLLQAAHHEVACALRAQGWPAGGPIDEQDAVLVGWSPARSAVVGRLFMRRHQSPGFVPVDITLNVAAPVEGLPSDCSLDCSTQAKMALLACKQAQLLREKHAAGGGPFIVAQVTREQIRIGKVCDLGAEPDSPAPPVRGRR